VDLKGKWKGRERGKERITIKRKRKRMEGFNFPLAGGRCAAFSGPFFFYDRTLHPT
jgi:hypothetical protein